MAQCKEIRNCRLQCMYVAQHCLVVFRFQQKPITIPAESRKGSRARIKLESYGLPLTGVGPKRSNIQVIEALVIGKPAVNRKGKYSARQALMH